MESTKVESKAEIKEDVKKAIIDDAINTSSPIINLPSTRLWIGHYRYGNTPPRTKVFANPGTLWDARDDFQMHCTRMGYKWCGTYPFLVDLREQEKLRNDESFKDEY